MSFVPPTVSKVEPAEGPAAGGTVVKITGTGFTEGALVKIGSAATGVEYKSETELKATTAATAVGKDEVFVTDAKGVNSAGPDFTYLAAPKVTSVSPAEGSTAGSTSITLKGTDFVAGAKVTLAGEEATSVVVVSATEITAKTPAGAAGKDEVVVVDADGTSSAGAGFTYITPPTVSAISPKEGTTAGGTSVKITGTGFVKGAKVKIGGEATSVTVVSGTEITAKTVAHAAGKFSVEVTENGVAQSATVEFTYATPPKVTSVSPAEGSKAGGWEVLIKGTEFSEHAKVTIGSEVAKVEWVSATELVVTTSAHAAGKAEVVVTNGELSSSGGPMYTYV
ncbi:MAG: IPT/TIG domain-containing protein [Solirubrobacteraceae bacterium]